MIQAGVSSAATATSRQKLIEVPSGRENDYLKDIAEYCLASLREQNQKDCLEAAKDSKSGIDREYCTRIANMDFWLPEYARPTSNNFQFWNLTKDGLLMSFEECRMAGCAAGPREVLIPFARLEGTLKPNGPFSSIISQ